MDILCGLFSFRFKSLCPLFLFRLHSLFLLWIFFVAYSHVSSPTRAIWAPLNILLSPWVELASLWKMQIIIFLGVNSWNDLFSGQWESEDVLVKMNFVCFEDLQFRWSSCFSFNARRHVDLLTNKILSEFLLLYKLFHLHEMHIQWSANKWTFSYGDAKTAN